MTNAKYATMTPRQARQAQLDEWRERHGFHHRQDTARMAQSTIDAVLRDEIDAYAADGFMSANRPVGDRIRAVAAIHALADFFRDHPTVPIPYSVTAYCQADEVDLRELAAWFGVKVYGERPQIDIRPAYAPVRVVVSCPPADRPL